MSERTTSESIEYYPQYLLVDTNGRSVWYPIDITDTYVRATQAIEKLRMNIPSRRNSQFRIVRRITTTTVEVDVVEHQDALVYTPTN